MYDSGWEILVVPSSTSAAAVWAMAPDGIFLSNGPGYPTPVENVVETIRELLGCRPIFGICLGIVRNYRDVPRDQLRRIGLLAFRSPPDKSCYQAVEVLSERGDLQEAAANFFAALHRLDGDGLDLIPAEPVPKTGLGFAIMDRLERASAPKE